MTQKDRLSTLCLADVSHRDKSFSILALLSLLICLLPSSLTLRAQSNAPEKLLDKGFLSLSNISTQSLQQGQAHIFLIAALPNQYLQVVIRQMLAHTRAALYDPTGKTVIETDVNPDVLEIESLGVITQSTGNYKLVITLSPEIVQAGHYTVELAELHEAKAQDLQRAKAFQLGCRALTTNVENVEKLFQLYNETMLPVAELFQKAGDPFNEAVFTNLAGHSYYSQRQFQKAYETYTRTKNIVATIGERKWEGRILSQLGVINYASGIGTPSLESYAQALIIHQEVKDVEAEADTLNRMGWLYRARGDFKKAMGMFQQALPLREQTGRDSKTSVTWNDLGGTYYRFGDYAEAIEAYQKAVDLNEKANEKAGLGVSLNWLGMAYFSLAENGKAIATLNRARELAAQQADYANHASVLNTLGTVYWQQGDSLQALNVLTEGLKLARQHKIRNGEAAILDNLALLYRGQLDYQKALEFSLQAQTIYQAINNKLMIATNQNHLGNRYLQLGQLEKAAEYFTQSLRIHQELGAKRGELDCWVGLGTVAYRNGKIAEALVAFQNVRQLSTKIKTIHLEADALRWIAQIQSEADRLDDALSAIQTSLPLLEEGRSRLVGRDARLFYSVKSQPYYELQTALLMQKFSVTKDAQILRQAIETVERSRAKTLVEEIHLKGSDFRSAPDQALLRQENQLQRKLNTLAATQTQLLGGKSSPEQLKQIEADIAQILSRLRQVHATLEQQNPHYMFLTRSSHFSIAEIQQQILDDETLLLEYSLGEKQSYLWVVSPTEIKSYPLPARQEITAVVRKVYEGLNVAPTASTNPQLDTDAKALSQMLLGAAAAQLGNKRLLIVAPEILAYLPFAALPDPTQANQPLMVNHEIVNLPSASVLAVLRRENANRPSAPKTVAVLADPVFEADDPRLALAKANKAKGSKPAISNESAANTTETDFARAVRSMNRATLGRLAFSREEAEAIAAFTTPAQSIKALSFDASRATAMSDQLSQYRIVHFATHGLLNSTQPELSGLVFSLLDERGKSQDGFLRLHEIYNLKLPADLVVLSACQTGLGKEVKGEGLIGLTRGFMYAGAPRVVASLWRVNDYATAELMKRFYRGLLKDNLRPAAALRAAQIEMWKRKQFAAPYYWAAFTLQGEWK